MRLNITAQPMYEDGTIGGEDPPMGASATLHANDHAAIGAFLAEQAEWWIGSADDGQLCDALDVTITREVVYSERQLAAVEAACRQTREQWAARPAPADPAIWTLTAAEAALLNAEEIK